MQDRPLKQSSSVYRTALAAYQSGVNVLPVRTDGSKRPALDGWKDYQQRRITMDEINRWFRGPERGIAVVTGEVSGNLEALDIDSPETYRVWLERIREHHLLRSVYERIARGYLEATPDGGRHLLYRCEVIERNQRLARRVLVGTQGYQMLLETRGQGGLLIVAPSSGRVHPSGRPYQLLCGGVADIATITSEERSQLLALARTFDEAPLKVYNDYMKYKQVSPVTSGLLSSRPGDLFNQSVSWEEVLQPHGWRLLRKVDQVGQWRRPGKRGPGMSATTNYAGNDLLYVFSTSTVFEPERGYTKFAAYVLLEYAGDFAAAARALSKS